MIVCVKCGHQNEEGCGHCGQCSARLPRLIHRASRPPEDQLFYERITELEDAADHVVFGHWDHNQYLQQLDLLRQQFQEREHSLLQLPIPPEIYEDFQEELEKGLAGIRHYLQALEVMASYVDNQDPDKLDEGLELARQGIHLLNEAMRLNHVQRQGSEEFSYGSSIPS